MDNYNLDNEIVESNKDMVDEMTIILSENIKTYSRDWTVETILKKKDEFIKAYSKTYPLNSNL